MRKPARGFTLLELIVVIAIFALFSIMAYGGLDSVLKTRHQVERAQERVAELQKAYMRLRNDFQQVRMRPARDNFGDTQAALTATDAGYVEFTRGGWRNSLYLPRSTLERVAYSIEDDRLVRLSWPVLDRGQDTQPVKLVLLDNIESVYWQYLDASREWRTRWPFDASGAQQAPAAIQPPLAVEVKIRTKDAGELSFLFRIGTDMPKIPPRGNATGSAPQGGQNGQGTQQ